MKNALGAPSFVFYNSTTTIVPDSKFASTPKTDFDNSINIDVIGAYVVSQEALSHLTKQKQGTLVFGNSPASKGEIGTVLYFLKLTFQLLQLLHPESLPSVALHFPFSANTLQRASMWLM